LGRPLPGQTAPAAEAGDPYKAVLDRLESLTTLPLPAWRFHADVAHPEDTGIDDSGWATMRTKDKWKDGSRALRMVIEIPETVNGYWVRGSRVSLDLFFTRPGRVLISEFSNGSMVFHGDDDQQQLIRLTEDARPGEKFLIAVRADPPEQDTELNRSRLIFEPPASRLDPGMLRTEILAARPLIAAFPEGQAEREKQVAAALTAIDFTGLERGDQTAFDASLRQAQANLEVLKPWIKQFTIRATGNSHIDMAWLWPWTETVEVVRNTFRSVLDLMREYPDFTFTMGSAQAYAWMEEKYPDLFKEIQQRVKEGRWEIVGGMWVEPDLNMPGGESLVRQILVGKRYFQRKFNVDVKIGWNPDSFGYNWQLPQIYKKAGLEYFVTQKLYWNDTTKFPHKLFWWEAPDGSRVLTYIPHDYANDTNPLKMATDLAAYAPAMYASEPPQGREMMHLFGVGDHGGGPTRTMLDIAGRWMSPDAVFPRLSFGTATGFFDDLQKSSADLNLPAWKDELYLEFHRGVFTTQAETKRRIRGSEELLLNAEKFAAVTMLDGQAYPSGEFDSAWKNLLFDDFHDIFPGSGTAVNYLDAQRNLEEVGRVGTGILEGSLAEIASRINTQGLGTPVAVFNPLAWARNEVMEIEAQLPSKAERIQVVDAAGKAAAAQVLSFDKETGRVRLLMRAGAPSLGYKTYYVRAAEKSAVPTGAVHSSAHTLENEFVRVTVDPKSGCITSFFDKRNSSEALAAAETDSGGPKDTVCGNLLQAFTDKPKQWDAWNIDSDFEKERWDLDHSDEVRLMESGPLRGVIRVRTHFRNSTFIQDIVVTAGSPRVDVRMSADWNEKHVLLKVAFPLSVHSDKATFEIPYGTIERPTTRNTPAEQAKFEVPALQWADLSDARHGFSLLNDSKYGYDAKGNVLRLSLLRAPEWPDPHADEGHHEFTYSLYAHAGTWREAETVRLGYALNYPLLARQVEKHPGKAGAERSFLQIEPDNVVVTAVKKAEDDGALIVRFYEWAGRETDVRFTVPAEAMTASDADLMERPLADLALRDGSVTVHAKPYEIKTVRIPLAAISAPAPAEKR
ncbi:MAG TPA: glycoside hydrolase family 38 C-terminal domain-containing protein, partial [Candidatus Dormibacteraeota bacterium]|nr:glycoside hydrolase family 38 C-terminal domain-containing protein [Candidatus Dormibacteraeota bacterium]